MILGGHHFAGANDAALCFKLYVAGRARGVVQMQFRLDRGLSGEVRLDTYRQTVEITAWIWEIYDIYIYLWYLWPFRNDVRTFQRKSRTGCERDWTACESTHKIRSTTTLHSCPPVVSNLFGAGAGVSHCFRCNHLSNLEFKAAKPWYSIWQLPFFQQLEVSTNSCYC